MYKYTNKNTHIIYNTHTNNKNKHKFRIILAIRDCNLFKKCNFTVDL